MSSKVCTKCKEEKQLDQFVKLRRVRSGRGSVCKTCRNTHDALRTYPSKQPEAIKAYNKSPAGCLRQYKSTAKINSRVFELTLEHFEAFWQKPCTYCGSDIATIGLDRVDSSKGYTLDNIVACCTVCNKLKWDHKTSAWLAHIRRIIEHQDRSQKA